MWNRNVPWPGNLVRMPGLENEASWSVDQISLNSKLVSFGTHTIPTMFFNWFIHCWKKKNNNKNNLILKKDNDKTMFNGLCKMYYLHLEIQAHICMSISHVTWCQHIPPVCMHVKWRIDSRHQAYAERDKTKNFAFSVLCCLTVNK